MPAMDAWILYFLVSVAVLIGTGVVAYFVLRRLFLQAAEKMGDQIGRALTELATVAMSGRAGQVSSSAAKVAMGRLTHLGAYAVAEGLSENAARAQFRRKIERVARIMDSAIKLPIVGGVGLDALLGLIPVAGDAASAVVSVSLIARSIRYGIPSEIITKMLANVLVDLLLGAVPLVGDLADIWFKANERNVALLNEYLGDEARDTIDTKVVSRA